jgi:hypothetical protein
MGQAGCRGWWQVLLLLLLLVRLVRMLQALSNGFL